MSHSCNRRRKTGDDRDYKQQDHLLRSLHDHEKVDDEEEEMSVDEVDEEGDSAGDSIGYMGGTSERDWSVKSPKSNIWP